LLNCEFPLGWHSSYHRRERLFCIERASTASANRRCTRVSYLVLAECGLILSETKAPQPNNHVHVGAHTVVEHHRPRREGVQYGSGLLVAPRPDPGADPVILY
jgi:hypothetical protein